MSYSGKIRERFLNLTADIIIIAGIICIVLYGNHGNVSKLIKIVLVYILTEKKGMQSY